MTQSRSPLAGRRLFLATAPAFILGFNSALGSDETPLMRLARFYEEQNKGRIGIQILDPANSRIWSWRANERFLMCSSFKASLAAYVLARCDRREDSLTRRLPYTERDIGTMYAPVAKASLTAGSLSIAALCAGAVTLSDNTCANLLLRHIGGPQALTAFWRRIGDSVSRLDAYEPILNRPALDQNANTTSPAALASTLHTLIFGDTLHPASRALLRNWMIGCKTGLNRLRSGFPDGWAIGDKTGNNGYDIAVDIAFAQPAERPQTPITVTVMTSGGIPNEHLFSRIFHDIGALAASLSLDAPSL